MMESFYSKQLNQTLTIQQKLGEGAFGITYLVMDEGEQEYVLKLLKLNNIDRWKVVERFQREASVLKQLNHDHIPKYYDTVEVDGTPGILQEFIAGKSLMEAIEGELILTQKQWGDCVDQGIKILNYLKSFQPPIIHRDISPKNLMLTDEGKLYLIDFGGVQLALSEHSRTVTTLGTFGYMAPEQLRGITSPESDLYSFGMSMLAVGNRLDAQQFPFDLDTGVLEIRMLLKKIPGVFHNQISTMCHPAAKKRIMIERRSEEGVREAVVPADYLGDFPFYPGDPDDDSIREAIVPRDYLTKKGEKEQRIRTKNEDSKTKKEDHFLMKSGWGIGIMGGLLLPMTINAVVLIIIGVIMVMIGKHISDKDDEFNL